jgi:hypothetical protein
VVALQTAHLALIDALMKAYASEIASVERVVQAVRLVAFIFALHSYFVDPFPPLIRNVLQRANNRLHSTDGR